MVSLKELAMKLVQILYPQLLTHHQFTSLPLEHQLNLPFSFPSLISFFEFLLLMNFQTHQNHFLCLNQNQSQMRNRSSSFSYSSYFSWTFSSFPILILVYCSHINELLHLYCFRLLYMGHMGH